MDKIMQINVLMPCILSILSVCYFRIKIFLSMFTCILFVLHITLVEISRHDNNGAKATRMALY